MRRANDPAFPDEDKRILDQLARDFAPGLTAIVNGHLDAAVEAERCLAGGADLVAIGKAELANHDWPLRAERGPEMQAPLAPSAFGDLATIQDWESQLNPDFVEAE